MVEKYLGFSYVPMANAMKEKYSCIQHIFVDSESGDISGMIAETYGENGAERTLLPLTVACRAFIELGST